MNFTFSLSKTKPAYIEIAKHIQKEIECGNLKKDEKLPSKRVLAQNLCVSINTILHAYLVLLDAQYIYSVEKKGYFVQEIKPKTQNQKIVIEPKKEDSRFDFTTKTIDEELFPKMIWKKLYKESLNSPYILKKSESQGLFSLRQAIAKHLYQNRGIHVSEEQIIIGSGIEYLLTLLLPLIKGKTYGVENPGYHKISTILQNAHKEILYLPIDSEGVCLDPNIDVLYTTSFNQFPLGIKMSMQRKQEINKWLQSKEGYCIEDDFDAEFRVNTTPSLSLFSLNPNQVIFLSSFSRTIHPALRISYMILPPRLLESYQTHYRTYANTVPTIDQLVLTNFITEGHYFTHINRLKRTYKFRREKIEDFFINQPNFKILSKNNYLYLLVLAPNKGNIPSSISIHTLQDYDIYEKKDTVLLIGYSNLKNKDIDDALNALCDCFQTKPLVE